MTPIQKKLLFSFLFLPALFLPLIAFGLEASYPPIFGMAITNASSLPQYFKYFFNAGILLAGFAAVIVVAFGGVYYLVSYGRGKFTSEAKDWIKSGILGLLILVCSYLILYTINPDLVILKMDGLFSISLNAGLSDDDSFGAKKIFFDEIPIGTLTENVLTRTVDCYDFDANGDPIPGVEVKTDSGQKVRAPTLRNHDRTDCILKLTEAANKKAEKIEKLSQEVSKLMRECNCSNNCTSTCSCPKPTSKYCTGNSNSDKALIKKCEDACKKTQCKGPSETGSSCPADIYKKIEHGPIQLEVAGDPWTETEEGKCPPPKMKDFAGLDEFRCPNPKNNSRCNDISTLVGRKHKIGGDEVLIIDTETFKKELNLIQQLTFYYEELKRISDQMKKDSEDLERAELMLSNCKFADSYIDFLKTFERSNKQYVLALTQPIFTDSVTNEPVNISNYCKGFSYSNSTCFTTCQKMCPDDSTQVTSCYKKCQCDPEDENCLKVQWMCVQDCYNSRPCKSENFDGNFSNCIIACKEGCKKDCEKIYPECHPEREKCLARCADDSRCLLYNNNESRCVFDPKSLVTCSTNSSQNNMKDCIDNSYTCKYGSNQNAGYLECTNGWANCKTYRGELYNTEFSASYLYKNPFTQRCPNAYEVCAYSDPNSESGVNPFINRTCEDTYPEVYKCPPSSDCPDCPCGVSEISQMNIKYTDEIGECAGGMPKIQCTDGTFACYCPEEAALPLTIIYPMDKYDFTDVSPKCDQYAYNDDPLTFYCQQSWWEKSEGSVDAPVGDKVHCSEMREIPVGKTIDDTELWASETLKSIDNYINKIKGLINYTKDIGDRINNKYKPYCSCASVCDSGDKICLSKCKFECKETTETTPDGTVTKKKTSSCVLDACKNNSCQQMIDLLLGGGGGEDAVCKSKKEGVGEFVRYMKQYQLDFKKTLTLKRSDILKELTYSRESVNKCSVAQGEYGKDEARMYSCERVKDEIMPPLNENRTVLDTATGIEYISRYCYGQVAGKYFNAQNQPLADNWFCCNTWEKENE